MTINRKTFMLAMLAGIAGSQTFKSSWSQSNISKTKDPVSFFRIQGYQYLEPLPLITGHDWNGGLRYDEAPLQETRPGKWMLVQRCARVEDFGKVSKQEILASFRLIYLVNNTGQSSLLSETLDFLIKEGGIEPARLSIVSTELFLPWISRLKTHGIKEEQVVVRPLEKAKQLGDGSGFFKPSGHPYSNGYATASIHYTPGKIITPKWPMDNSIELGEYVIDDLKDEIGLGYERILMAMGQKILSYQESRDLLLKELSTEAKERGIELPMGYHEALRKSQI